MRVPSEWRRVGCVFLALSWLLSLMNGLDAILTALVVSAGLAEELNPLMAALLEWGVVPFIIVKITVVETGIRILRHACPHPWAYGALLVSVLAYALTLAVHVHGLCG